MVLKNGFNLFQLIKFQKKCYFTYQNGCNNLVNIVKNKLKYNLSHLYNEVLSL